jgi:diaminohydroxyphosphoribosylaminopyrimidine deaminase / 5-amino-6-(5-phosphoribosylamino)uracil reductase
MIYIAVVTAPDSFPASFKEHSAHAVFMQRCLQLAELGAGFTAPNPLVGAILVHEGRIIGEGYHRFFGEPHAEVNCIQSVKSANRGLIPSSTMYVSLEPCCHYGKTPPCTELILGEKIKKVVVGCRDPFPLVDGKGIEKLRAQGVVVEYPVLETLAIEKNRRFFTFHRLNRPYIILKWAESANHKIAAEQGGRTVISNAWSNRLVHKWRTEEAGILIGTDTALLDNPQLTARLWAGKNPVRIVVDHQLRLPVSLNLFDGTVSTIILNGKKDGREGNSLFKKIPSEKPDPASILSALHSLQIMSILVEGGAKLLQSFINAGFWDEIRIITNQDLVLPGGISSPEFRDALFVKSETYGSDRVSFYRNPKIYSPK